jgi:hypothetical protein
MSVNLTLPDAPAKLLTVESPPALSGIALHNNRSIPSAVLRWENFTTKAMEPLAGIPTTAWDSRFDT